MSTLKPTGDLIVRAPFKDLFPVEPDVLAATIASIRRDGFDTERPIFVWRTGSELVVIDGHTRLAAAKRARLREVRVVVRKFASEEAAFAFAVAAQRDRRNLTKEQIATAIARAELAKNGSADQATLARSVGKDRNARGQIKGSTKDPVKQAVVEKAAQVGIPERTARRGLANARAERKPRATAQPPKPKPVPTVADLKQLQATGLEAAREVGTALTAAGRSDTIANLEAVGQAAVGAVTTYNELLVKLTKIIDSKEQAT